MRFMWLKFGYKYTSRFEMNMSVLINKLLGF